MKNDLADEKIRRERRIRRAVDLFDKNFTKDGNPVTIKGIMLFFRYGWFDNHWSPAGKILYRVAAMLYKMSLIRDKVTNIFRRNKDD